jgi:hypothetical protein
LTYDKKQPRTDVAFGTSTSTTVAFLTIHVLRPTYSLLIPPDDETVASMVLAGKPYNGISERPYLAKDIWGIAIDKMKASEA